MIRKVILVFILYSGVLASDNIHFGPTVGSGRFFYKADHSVPAVMYNVGGFIRIPVTDIYSLQLDLLYKTITIGQEISVDFININKSITGHYSFYYTFDYFSILIFQGNIPT